MKWILTMIYIGGCKTPYYPFTWLERPNMSNNQCKVLKNPSSEKILIVLFTLMKGGARALSRAFLFRSASICRWRSILASFSRWRLSRSQVCNNDHKSLCALESSSYSSFIGHIDQICVELQKLVLILLSLNTRNSSLPQIQALKSSFNKYGLYSKLHKFPQVHNIVFNHGIKREKWTLEIKQIIYLFQLHCSHSIFIWKLKSC